MEQLEKSITSFSVREVGDHSRLFFESVVEFSQQDDLVQQAIKDALKIFISDPAEAKNSPRAVSWLAAVGAAGRAGDIRSLYPRGSNRIEDIPWYLQVAIEQALTIISWHENLAKNEVPPEHIWEDGKGLELWWARLEELRESGRPPGSGDEPVPEMAQNDLARAFREG